MPCNAADTASFTGEGEQNGEGANFTDMGGQTGEGQQGQQQWGECNPQQHDRASHSSNAADTQGQGQEGAGVAPYPHADVNYSGAQEGEEGELPQLSSHHPRESVSFDPPQERCAGVRFCNDIGHIVAPSP